MMKIEKMNDMSISVCRQHMFPYCVYLQVLEVMAAVAMVVVEEVAAAAVVMVETVVDHVSHHIVYHCKYTGVPLGWLLCHSDIFIKINSKEKIFIFYQWVIIRQKIVVFDSVQYLGFDNSPYVNIIMLTLACRNFAVYCILDYVNISIFLHIIYRQGISVINPEEILGSKLEYNCSHQEYILPQTRVSS